MAEAFTISIIWSTIAWGVRIDIGNDRLDLLACDRPYVEAFTLRLPQQFRILQRIGKGRAQRLRAIGGQIRRAANGHAISSQATASFSNWRSCLALYIIHRKRHFGHGRALLQARLQQQVDLLVAGPRGTSRHQ